MTLTRPRLVFLGTFAVVALLTYLGLMLFGPRVAGAAVVVASAGAASPPEPLGWPEYLGLALAALAGIRVIVDTLLGAFNWLAPRTKTTVDDTIRDDLKLAHDKLDALATLVGAMRPATGPTPSGAALKDGAA